MNIALYWEQELSGGVDSHLLTLLQGWNCEEDKFTIFYNFGNLGFARISNEINKIENVRCIAVSSISHNQLNNRISSRKIIHSLLRPFLYTAHPILFF